MARNKVLMKESIRKLTNGEWHSDHEAGIMLIEFSHAISETTIYADFMECTSDTGMGSKEILFAVNVFLENNNISLRAVAVRTNANEDGFDWKFEERK